MSPEQDGSEDEGSLEKARFMVEAALERKAERPVVLDVREVSSFANAFVVLEGRSDRQVRAIADGVVRALKQRGDAPLGVEGADEGRWVLIDANDVICHVFDPETRAMYDLERLWSDAPSLDLAVAAGGSGGDAPGGGQ